MRRPAIGLLVAISVALEAPAAAPQTVVVKYASPTPDQELPPGPPPPGVIVEVTQAPSVLIVTLRRTGYIVALRAGGGVSVAQDWVAARVLQGPVPAELELAWETTDPSSLETDRGVLRLEPGARPLLLGVHKPSVVAKHENHLHTCLAHAGFDDGFAVLCRVSKKARKVSVTNATEEPLLSNVWLSSGPARVARIDLLPAEGEARGAVLGYLEGANAIVVRAEATWATGEGQPTIALFNAARRQPVVTWGLEGAVFR